MIISHKHKFIFIKTVKTAGTSIEVFLSQQSGPDDVVTMITPPFEGQIAKLEDVLLAAAGKAGRGAPSIA